MNTRAHESSTSTAAGVRRRPAWGVFVLSYVFVLACMGMIVQPQVRELLHDPSPRAVIGVAAGCVATAVALLVERWMLRAHGWVGAGGWMPRR